MNWLNTLFWYLQNIWQYTIQMLPCMAMATLLFLLLYPIRKRRLERLSLISSGGREAALLFFAMFMAGLAALTIFPADFWPHAVSAIISGEEICWGDFYPTLPQAMARLEDLESLILPFEEIRRAFRAGPWFMFLLLANIGIFLPVGFFISLLWRKPSVFKSVLFGFFCSVTIEFIQLFVNRRTDVDDVILNTLGTLVGHILFCLLRAIFPRQIQYFHCRNVKEPH